MSQRISQERLATIVREKREAFKYTQEQLGLKTSINRNTIRLIEKGAHIPSIPQLNLLIEVLHFTYEDITEDVANEADDVFVAMMGLAETEEEKAGFETMIERMLCLMKYNRLEKIYMK